MYQLAKVIVLAALAAFSSAAPQGRQGSGNIEGYGTFNKYSTQNGINCKNDFFDQKGVNLIADNSRIFGAAISDVSTALAKIYTRKGPYKCEYTPSDTAHNTSQCIATPEGGAPYKLPTYDTYKAPFCPGAPCGKCYTITNKANMKKILVQIIDACPADTAWNYCKAPAVEASQRCADPNTNQVDIDESAYPFLSDGEAYQS
ncbi:MAG: hypothetical protein Q9216_002688, partial [Gyalolechia sp. 2 TL-2023]